MTQQLRKNESTGKWEICDPELENADSYIAVDNRSTFVVVKTAQEAEAFLIENGVGGSVYAILHHQHNDEILPQSTLYKEVAANA